MELVHGEIVIVVVCPDCGEVFDATEQDGMYEKAQNGSLDGEIITCANCATDFKLSLEL